jgi:hypothetical protein
MDLLHDQQVNFHLLNIYDPDPEVKEGMKEITLGRLKERVERLQQRAGKQHRITGHYSEEKLVNAARNFVEQYKIDLIVMGAVGSKQRHSTILGRHTFEIISKIKCNILAVAEDSRFKVPKKLLMPFDNSASFSENNVKFLNHPGIFKKAHLEIWEFAGSENVINANKDGKKEVFAGLNNFKVNFSILEEPSIQDENIWLDVQKRFDMIVLLGKNIRICNRLLHNRHGLYATVPNDLPILVLHD